MSSWDSIIYFVVKRPYDFILTLILRKVNKNKRYVIFEERGDFFVYSNPLKLSKILSFESVALSTKTT